MNTKPFLCGNRIIILSILHNFFKILLENGIPSNTGLKSNCRKCGSNVAPRKPIDALVAIILKAHTTIPGIFINAGIDAKKRTKQHLLAVHFLIFMFLFDLSIKRNRQKFESELTS